MDMEFWQGLGSELLSNIVLGRSRLIPQTGLALMGFSRYCPSSLDLPHFVVRECRGATAEECSSRSRWPKPGQGPDFGNLGPGNPEIWNPKVLKIEHSQNPNPFCPKCRQGLD